MFPKYKFDDLQHLLSCTNKNFDVIAINHDNKNQLLKPG